MENLDFLLNFRHGISMNWHFDQCLRWNSQQREPKGKWLAKYECIQTIYSHTFTMRFFLYMKSSENRCLIDFYSSILWMMSVSSSQYCIFLNVYFFLSGRLNDWQVFNLLSINRISRRKMKNNNDKMWMKYKLWRWPSNRLSSNS